MASKELVLKAEKRQNVGSKVAAKIRAAKKVPAIVYGHKQEPLAISIDEHELIEGLHHGHRLFDIELDGKTEKLMIKDIQHDYLGSKIIHADFIRVDLSERVTVEVPLNFKGKPAGASEGGIFEAHVNMLEVECAVVSIPTSIDVSIKTMKVDDTILAKDIALPAGVKLITDPEIIVAACYVPTEAPVVTEPTGEEPTTPEVITERKPKEGEEAEEK